MSPDKDTVRFLLENVPFFSGSTVQWRNTHDFKALYFNNGFQKYFFRVNLYSYFAMLFFCQIANEVLQRNLRSLRESNHIMIGYFSRISTKKNLHVTSFLMIRLSY